MAKIIAVANRKGGVGKTTTAICLAHFLGRHDRSVLLIDLDPQNALSSAAIPPHRKTFAGAIDIVRGAADARDVISPTPLANVDLIPYGSAESLSQDHEALFALAHTRQQFAQSLENLPKPYDYVLVDSPPGSSAIVQLALLCAESVIIPLQCQPLALRIMPRILTDIKRLISSARPSFKIEGVLLTMYDDWDPISQSVAHQVWSFFPHELIFRVAIRRSHIFQDIFIPDKNALLQENPPEELFDYDLVAQSILSREHKAPPGL